MPGKVNPSIPEMVNQVCYQVIGCDAAILAAADAGQLELNVMMPVIAWNALHATRIMANALTVLQERCVAGIRADEDRCRELLDRSTAVATALSPYIGYAATAAIAKTAVATGRPIRDLVREQRLLPDDELDAILSAEGMTTPGIPGVRKRKGRKGRTGARETNANRRVAARGAARDAQRAADRRATRPAVSAKGPGAARGAGSRRLAAAGAGHGRPRDLRRQRRR
jgi:hypothetical protein